MVCSDGGGGGGGVCECVVTYRGVEKAFIVHCQVEFGLDTLDGHHTKPHWDQVEHSYICTHTQPHTTTDSKKMNIHKECNRGKHREKSPSISI